MDQSDESHNGKYICLYAEDAAGNYATAVSANPINIDITPPTITLVGNPTNGTQLTNGQVVHVTATLSEISADFT